MADGALIKLQLPPPSSEYCQAPLADAAAVTAIPESAPVLSVTWVPSSEDTRVPAPPVLSSRMAGRLSAPLSTGAVLLAARLTWTTKASWPEGAASYAPGLDRPVLDVVEAT